MSNEMDKIQVYCECMEHVDVPEKLKDKILSKKIKRKKSKNLKMAYGMAAVIALFVISNISTYAVYGSTWVGYIVNKSTIFCESDEEIKENPVIYAAGHDLLGIYPENTTVEGATVEETYALWFSVGEGQKLISDDTWEEDGKTYRKLEKYFSDTIIRETYAAKDVADLVSFVPQVAKWNLSWLGEKYQAVEKGQLLDMDKKAGSEEIIGAYLYGNYESEDGKKLSLWFGYSWDENRFETSEYLNKNDFDYIEYYTTKDGVDIAIMGKGNEAVGQFSSKGYYLSISGTNLTKKEMEEIADHLDLATLVKSQ